MPKPKLKFISDYRSGIKILSVFLLALIIVSWLLNIRPTFQKYKANQHYNKRLALSTNISSNKSTLESQLKNLENVAIKSYDRDLLLSSIASFCKRNNMLIRNFPSTERHQKNGMEYITNLIEVEGDYNNITQLAYMLEHEKMLGSISSLEFKSFEDRVEKKTRLRGTMILRNINTQ